MLNPQILFFIMTKMLFFFKVIKTSVIFKVFFSNSVIFESFKLRLFDLTELIVLIIYGLRHFVAKIHMGFVANTKNGVLKKFRF